MSAPIQGPTQGPWQAKRLSSYENPGWVILRPTHGGARQSRLDSQGNFTGPDAALIAAAPELLAIVQELEACSECWSDYFVPLGIQDRMRAALAKALPPPF